jgi:hypothetical protein
LFSLSPDRAACCCEVFQLLSDKSKWKEEEHGRWPKSLLFFVAARFFTSFVCCWEVFQPLSHNPNGSLMNLSCQSINP